MRFIYSSNFIFKHISKKALDYDYLFYYDPKAFVSHVFDQWVWPTSDCYDLLGKGELEPEWTNGVKPTYKKKYEFLIDGH